MSRCVVDVTSSGVSSWGLQSSATNSWCVMMFYRNVLKCGNVWRRGVNCFQCLQYSAISFMSIERLSIRVGEHRRYFYNILNGLNNILANGDSNYLFRDDEEYAPALHLILIDEDMSTIWLPNQIFPIVIEFLFWTQLVPKLLNFQNLLRSILEILTVFPFWIYNLL